MTIENIKIGHLGADFRAIGRSRPAPERTSHACRRACCANLTISNVRAEGGLRHGLPHRGLTGHPIENLTLRNIKIFFAGGGRQEDTVRRFDEQEKAGQYPEATMFAGRLPASGLYCWHVKGLRLENVQLTTLRPDQRPAIALEDADRRDARWQEGGSSQSAA